MPLVVTAVLQQISTVVLGLFAGAMLLIGVSIVGFWLSLEPRDFVAWFHEHAPRIGGLMIPLGATATLLSIAVAALSWRSAERTWFALAAALTLTIALIYPAYYAAANEALGSGALSDADVTAELLRWRTWHWIRVGLGIAALAASVRGVRGSR